ncbi:MAG: hypothetical protein QM811_31610 [Pirellulales bacterium]
MTLVGNNTLAGLTIDNYGGIATPTVTTGGVLTLTGTLNATSSNVSTLPVVNGTLDFGGTARTFTIAPIAYDGRTLNALQPTMNVAGIIQNAGTITVAGGGKLQLSGQNTFTGGVTIDTSTAGTGLVLREQHAGLGNAHQRSAWYRDFDRRCGGNAALDDRCFDRQCARSARQYEFRGH